MSRKTVSERKANNAGQPVRSLLFPISFPSPQASQANASERKRERTFQPGQLSQHPRPDRKPARPQAEDGQERPVAGVLVVGDVSHRAAEVLEGRPAVVHVPEGGLWEVRWMEEGISSCAGAPLSPSRPSPFASDAGARYARRVLPA